MNKPELSAETRIKRSLVEIEQLSRLLQDADLHKDDLDKVFDIIRKRAAQMQADYYFEIECEDNERS